MYMVKKDSLLKESILHSSLKETTMTVFDVKRQKDSTVLFLCERRIF